MNVIALPKGFIRFSLSMSTALALCAWILYELSPVSTICSDWPLLQLLVISTKIVLILALMIASFGVGAGSLLLGKSYWRSKFKSVPHNPWLRRTQRGFKAVTAALICLTSLIIGESCIGTWNFFSGFVLFGGLQVSSLLMWRRYLRWRYFRDRITF